MQNKYEAVFVISSKLSESELKEVTEGLRKLIESKDKVKIVDTIADTRQFAYLIKKETKGTFFTVRFEAPPETISLIKDDIKHREEILRSTFIKKEK